MGDMSQVFICLMAVSACSCKLGKLSLEEEVEKRLEEVLANHMDAWSKMEKSLEGTREGRSGFPTIKRKRKKIWGCQNMAGILGGSNAFNFINFVAAVVTLVVNINNNINNNNNNLNNVAVNTNNANNADANVNNAGANIVIAMPGRRRRSVPLPRNLQDLMSPTCLARGVSSSSELANLALGLTSLLQENSNLTKWGEAATAIQEFGKM